jgi:multidrug efflux pump subunit AcrA (membrane-fusion protein)
VLNREDGQKVFVVEEGVAVERTVRVEGIEDDLALIGGGLEPGDRLVVDGQRQVGPGEPVRVREAP